jgi:uncharacterized phiE125 gp8 family phage protein
MDYYNLFNYPRSGSQQGWSLALVTPPTMTPYDLTNLKLHCRLNTSIEDSLLTDFAQAATELWERSTGYTPCQTTYELRLDGVAGRVVSLPRRPVTSVGTVQYLDSNETWQTLAGTSTDLGGSVARVQFPDSIPSMSTSGLPRIRIQFTAGHSSEGSVPATIRTAISRLACHYFRSRDLGGSDGSPLPPNWGWSVDSYRLPLSADLWERRSYQAGYHTLLYGGY